MKYLKIYEEFKTVERDKEISDYTIDDMLDDDFFTNDTIEDEEIIEDDDSYVDKNGIIHIKNWVRY